MSAPTPVEILTGAREILSDPARWTVEASARDANGAACDVYSPEATCFCAVGALIKAGYVQYHDGTSALADTYFQAREVIYRVTSKSLIDVNDYEGREAVLEILDQAIAQASA